MPRIKRYLLDHKAFYDAKGLSDRSMIENKDCAVVAVAAATGRPYTEVFEVMKANGRRDNCGTPMAITKATLAQFGFEIEEVSINFFIEQYPKAHQILRTVTSHHPDRFKKVWQDGHTYLMRTNSHILTVRNGVNCDWSRGRALRALWIYRVTKKEA